MGSSSWPFPKSDEAVWSFYFDETIRSAGSLFQRRGGAPSPKAIAGLEPCQEIVGRDVTLLPDAASRDFISWRKLASSKAYFSRRPTGVHLTAAPRKQLRYHHGWGKLRPCLRRLWITAAFPWFRCTYNAESGITSLTTPWGNEMSSYQG